VFKVPKKASGLLLTSQSVSQSTLEKAKRCQIKRKFPRHCQMRRKKKPQNKNKNPKGQKHGKRGDGTSPCWIWP
jgi:hypothetical protein